MKPRNYTSIKVKKALEGLKERQQKRMARREEKKPKVNEYNKGYRELNCAIY